MAVIYKMKLAEQVIQVSALFPSTKIFCHKYLTDQRVDFSIETTWNDIEYEREKSAREDEKEGNMVRQFSDEYLETLAVYRKIAEKLLTYDTLLFHGSAIAVDGDAYLFTAKSGTGKSTHTRLWRELFEKRAVMINDDKPLLRISDTGVVVYGTPWDGKHRLSNNIAVPLRGVCILARSEINQIASTSKSAAFPMLLQQSYRPESVEAMKKVLELVNTLGNRVKLYKLGCNMEITAAQMAYDVMHR